MAPELSRLVRRTTLVLLALAAAATEIAAADRRSLAISLGLAAFWVGVAALLGWRVRPPADGRRRPPGFVLPVLLLLAAAPFALEPLRRGWTGTGYPLELQMVFALRNLGLGLAAFSAWVLCLRLACVVSLFLMLFAVSLTGHPAVLTLLGLYSAAGSVWLMLVYWSGLRQFFVASETAVALEVRPGRERPPWLAVSVVVALVGGVLALVAVGPQRAARTLAEWLATSGGTGAYDPFARGGINDGDDEASGSDPRSTGMTQTETYLDSPLPSLYDALNEKYGEPFKPKERQRAIALPTQVKVKESKKPPADNLRPNREFPTARKAPRQPRDLSDRPARAIFEVQGRTPLHVRVTAFDAFDGIAWREAERQGGGCLLVKEPNGCWMEVREQQPPAVFAEPEAHRFKITRPEGALVPTPPHLLRFRVGRVNRANFFDWSQERILCMAQRKTPAGIVVETECRTVDPRRLDTLEFPAAGEARDAAPPSPLRPEVAALANRWARGHAKGWPQIAEVVRRLRTEYVLDATARVPDDCTDPVGHFLLHARRGPDYQFASAAALLLRALGYQTRLVSGFYVSPEHYDPETAHTPVVWEDLHFWAEVRLPRGDWLVLEPSPGYEVLGPNLSLPQRLWAALVGAAAWAWRHVIELSLGLVVLGGLWRWRSDLADAAGVTLWRWFPGRTWRECVRRALRLLERRGRWAGRPRPNCQTVASWLRQQPSAEVGLGRLTELAEWAAYAPGPGPPWPEGEVRGVCRRVLDDWTLRRWRAGAAARSGA